MSIDNQHLMAQLNQRGLISQTTADKELLLHLQEPRTLYCGFDPTSDSLHIGNLLPILMLRRFQQAGHQPIALVGGATGLIGDPSFKAQERHLNSAAKVAEWGQQLQRQLSQFLDFEAPNNPAIIDNNYNWTKDLLVLDFLRDTGKHFSVNTMIQKEAVEQRINREEVGISFTEFTYTLLQSLDFSELFQRYNCSLQIGGSDQWGNITAGIDLVRRLHRHKVYGLTLPLITKSDGKKFGKSETGNIWLSGDKTSPYRFYQFWLNTSDSDVYQFLSFFTFLPVDTINQLQQEDQGRQAGPEATAILAEEVTKLVHGEASYQAARRISQLLFSGAVDQLSVDDCQQLQQDGMPCTQLDDDLMRPGSLTSLLSHIKLAKSGKQIKDSLANKALRINNRVINSADNTNLKQVFSRSNALYEHYFIVRLGKKNYCMLTL